MRRIFAAATILFFLASAVVSHASDELQLKSTLESRYGAMKIAMAARDSEAIRSLLAPDFVSVDVTGTPEGADEMVKEVTALPTDPNKVSQTVIKSISRTGNKATVVQQYHMSTIRPTTGGVAPQAIALLTSSTDTWHLVAGRWNMERTETDELQYSVNGKIVVHKTRQR